MLHCHLRDVNETLNVVAQFDEGAERNDLGHATINDGVDRINLNELDPRIFRGLLETEGDALTLQIDIEYFNLNLFVDLNDLRRMVDMALRELGDVDKTVDTAEVDECAEVDDRGNGALEAHALRELLEDLCTLVLAA